MLNCALSSCCSSHSLQYHGFAFLDACEWRTSSELRRTCRTWSLVLRFSSARTMIDSRALSVCLSGSCSFQQIRVKSRGLASLPRATSLIGGNFSSFVRNGLRRETEPAARTVLVNAKSSGHPFVAEGSFPGATRQVHSEKEESSRQDRHLESIASTPPQTERGLPMNLAAGVGVTAAVFLMAVLGFLAKPRENQGGSVSDLVKRGQLRSDRGADSRTLKFEDPFNNPLVKVGKKNPIIKMCGKLFRLAPVTLTEEKRISHQSRRVQAYKWKRPSVFLVEGEPVPEGVDPEEVRWIPSNHPFATTKNYIEEGLAQQNVYQTRGVPSRVKAEHEALRKKMMEAASKDLDFQFPDSTKQQWGITPSADDNTDSTVARTRTSAEQRTNGDNGSFRLRNIDGSEVSDPGPTTVV